MEIIMNMKEKAMKSCKVTSIILLLCIIVIISSMIKNVVSIITIQKANVNELSVSEIYDKEMKISNFHLVSNNIDFGFIDYNEYNKVDNDGKHHYKAQMIINTVSNMVFELIVLIAVCITLFIVYGCTKEFKPFSIKYIRGLKIISLCVMLVALLPGAVKITLTFVVYFRAEGTFDFMCIIIFILGGALWGISNVFGYGNKLQDEIDFIA